MTPGAFADRAAIDRGYRDEADRTLRARLVAIIVVYLFFVGLGCLQELVIHPWFMRLVAWTYAAHVGVCAVALAVAYLPGALGWQRTIGAGLGMAMVSILNTYNGLAGVGAERAALVESALLNGLLVTLPQGWMGQGATGVACLAGFMVAGPYLESADTQGFAVIVLLTAATTTTLGAYVLERYRYNAFVRAAQQAEEAAIAAGLSHLGETLYRHLDESDLLERVNRLAVELLGCDWSASFLWDAAAGAFPLGAHAGLSPRVVERLRAVERTWMGTALIAALRPGAVLEIADARTQQLVDPHLLAQLELASSLHTPITRGSELVAVLVHGYRAHRGPFGVRHHRLALGIAHTTAVALENARLIGDLKNANQFKSEFVSTMSHELRTPLNVISGYAELLSEEAFGPLLPAQQDTVMRMRRSALELLAMITATLDLGRLEAGRETVAVTPVELARVFGELEIELGPLVSPDVALGWEVVPPTATSATDRGKLKTIVKNLAGNAIKFTTAGHITVRARTDGQRLHLVVSDTGIGIAPTDLSTIFEMFRQVDGSSTRRYHGVGLGLFIVRRLVDLLGGEIRVESTPGEGSTFTVELPLDLPSRPAGDSPALV